MITLEQFFQITKYRITEGGIYGWNCYGSNAYCIDSWNSERDGYTASIVFDTVTQVVYEATAYDYQNTRAYRLINPAYKSAHAEETKSREVNDIAWELDDGTPVKYCDLEVDDDFVEKAKGIVEGVQYDVRIQVPITLDDKELLDLMLIAHKRDITFNHLVTEILEKVINDQRN